MRAAIYNPYLDTLGGGERYTISFAKVLEGKGYKVDVQWSDPEIRAKLEERFGTNLENVNFVKNVKRGDNYDVCFWLSDGSIPVLRARNNILHFQIPFTGVNGKTLINKMKFYRINHVICNSYFTKNYIDKEFGVDSEVIYPPVSISELKPTKKENLIISVGRFSQLAQAKRQDILISTFKKLYDKGYKKWKLALAGGVEVGARDFINKLKGKTKGYPIDVIESPSWKELRGLYGRAKIFWSASGFGIDEKTEPLKVEHFGITTVEAMASGNIVLVFDAGGHREIISDGVNGYLWKSTKLLLSKTEKLIEDTSTAKKISQQAIKESKVYEYERFKVQVLEII